MPATGVRLGWVRGGARAVSDRVRLELAMSLRDLYPGYFALVMATGILSVGTERLGMTLLSAGLLWVASLAYGVLCALSAARAWFFRQRFLQDLRDPQRMFTFFTFVAGSAVLGVRLLSAGHVAAAEALGALGAAAWWLLSYSTFGTLFLTNEKPLVAAINGGWLIVVVGTQSVAIIVCHLVGRLPGESAWTFGAYALWATGVLLYVVLLTLIVLRLGFHRLEAADLSPPYWINMGAVAISTVAAAALLSPAAGQPVLRPAVPALYAAMVALWSWGTWWIPLLVIMGVWKYGVRRVALVYEPTLWSLVFPLGMYTFATLEVSRVTGLRALAQFAAAFVWVALGAWLLVSCGWVGAVGRRTLAVFAGARPVGPRSGRARRAPAFESGGGSRAAAGRTVSTVATTAAGAVMPSAGARAPATDHAARDADSRASERNLKTLGRSRRV